VQHHRPVLLAIDADGRFEARVRGRRDGVEAPLRYTLVKGMRAKIIRCL